MENLPSPKRPEPEVVEPEIIEPEVVGYETPTSLWKRLLTRAMFGVFLGVCGLGMMVIGALFTISIIGAAIGIPLLIMGLAILVLAAMIFFGGGRFIQIHKRF